MTQSLKKLKTVTWAAVLLLASAAAACAQTPAPAAEQAPKNPPKTGADAQPRQKSPDAANPDAAKKDAEQRISPEEAAELFKSVDEILQFVSKDTGLPIKTPVKRELASRETVEKYIAEQAEQDEDRKRFERTELVLKKFGLLPRDFDLRPFMVRLLRDQVAGFYDSKRKTVHMLDWVPVDAQRPVLAHELTHALQDQDVDLEQWLKDLRKQVKAKLDEDNADGDIDEEISARTALLEGQGMAVLIDYILNPMGHSMEDSPRVVEAMKFQMSSNEGSPLLKEAPMLLRESLVFPYRDGLGFVQALLTEGGKKRAYGGALLQPPHDTHEILSPKSYLNNAKVPLLLLPNLKPAMEKNYERYDAGSVGQFDIVLLMKQFADDEAAKQLSPEWRGGIYYAALRKGAASSKAALKTGDLGLVYLSKWASAAAGKRFADIYKDSLKKRYSTLEPTNSGWRTEEGPVSIQTFGDYVLVMEGLDDKTAAATRKIMQESTLGKGEGRAVAQSNLSIRTVAPVFALRLLMGE
jgi:hypothetical protein